MGQSMLKLDRRTGTRVGVLGLTLAVVTLAFTLFFLVGAGGSASPLPLDGVDFAGLERQGINLESPPDDAPAQATIPEVAAQKNAGVPLPIKQTVLGRLITENTVPQYDRLVWIVSYDATSFPPPGGPAPLDGSAVTDDIPDGTTRYAPASYMLAFVDAQTGEFLFSIRANYLK